MKTKTSVKTNDAGHAFLAAATAQAAIRRFADDSAVSKACGNSWRWREDLFGNNEKYTCYSPANALWLLTKGLSQYDTHQILPGSWDVSVEEWRLMDV